MPSTRRTRPPDAAPAAPAGSVVRVLKKYPNRRLYDSQSSSYITLTDVKRMVMGNEAFEVRDAKTGEDITRSILLQIILEEESGGVPMFSTQTLAQIIRFYGHAMQGVMGAFMEQNLRSLVELQGRLLEHGKGLYDPKAFTPEMWTQFFGAPVNPYLEQSKAMFDRFQEQLQKGTLFPGMPGLRGDK